VNNEEETMGNNILVVDDEQDMRDYLKSLLEDHDYSVQTAVNGVDAMELIKRESPALILLDLQMPAETGTGLYRRLREHKELRDIPVVVISGLAGRNVAVSKSVVVLDKPIDEERLLRLVEEVFDGRGAAAQ
jgi:CheY-like chemotaxis protein